MQYNIYRKLKIVVLGYIVRGPYGGLVWHHLQYVLGLRQLGHNVLFVEDSDHYPSCSIPGQGELTTDPSYGIKFIEPLFKHFDLAGNWTYFDEHTNTWFGSPKKKVMEFCNAADVVINISAINPVREWWQKIPARVLIDTDPVFTQVRHLQNPFDLDMAKQHTSFFSFGENIGKPSCAIPPDGLNWQPTRQPLYKEAWKYDRPVDSGKWTTVMQWDSYKEVRYEGQLFGMKSLSFQSFQKLPQMLPQPFELAIGGATTPKASLVSNGWEVINSLEPTATPWSYQQYIQQSKGEWSVAKHGYVVSNSGWFSERSLCYLATGKPVIVQDTGFSEQLPTGLGLLSFNTLHEAVACFELVNSDYSFHCTRAREIAETYFAAEIVLDALLKRMS